MAQCPAICTYALNQSLRNYHSCKKLFFPSVSLEGMEFPNNPVKHNLNCLTNSINRYSCVKNWGHSLSSSTKSFYLVIFLSCKPSTLLYGIQLKHESCKPHCFCQLNQQTKESSSVSIKTNETCCWRTGFLGNWLDTIPSYISPSCALSSSPPYSQLSLVMSRVWNTGLGIFIWHLSFPQLLSFITPRNVGDFHLFPLPTSSSQRKLCWKLLESIYRIMKDK